MAAAGSLRRRSRRDARATAATLAKVLLLLCAAAPLRPACAGGIQDQVKNWLDWITGKDTQQPSGGGDDPAEPPGSSSTLNCSPRAGTTTCILQCALQHRLRQTRAQHRGWNAGDHTLGRLWMRASA